MFHSSSSMIKSGGKHLPKTTKNLFRINSLEALSWETWFCLFKKSNMYLIVYIVAFELETWKKLEPIQEIHTFHILFDFPM